MCSVIVCKGIFIMPAGVQAIGLFVPIVASNAVFSARRASRGVNSIDENPIYGAMNMDIAAGQTLKAAKAAKEIATASNIDTKIIAEGASEAIKNVSKNNKVLSGIGKLIDKTANNINTVICLTSGAKVLFCKDDDKVDAAAREVIRLGTMFGTEKAYKWLVYKNKLFMGEQIKAMEDYCLTKNLFNKIPLKGVLGVLGGLGFAGASILGYNKIGSKLENCILGEKEKNLKKMINGVLELS